MKKICIDKDVEVQITADTWLGEAVDSGIGSDPEILS